VESDHKIEPVVNRALSYHEASGGERMLGLPLAIWYLIFLLFFVAILFVGFKRPIYEVMALAFIFIVVITGRFDLFWSSLIYPSTSSLFYAIFAFMVVAVIFDETKVVERIINLIMSV